MLSRYGILRLGVSTAICTALRKRVLNCLWELTYRCRQMAAHDDWRPVSSLAARR
jgi:hypothetical protein